MNDFFQHPSILVFFHNATNGIRFNDFEEAKRCNAKDKYSALYKISPSYRVNGKYEFLLEYKEGFVHWRQSNNPLHETEQGTASVKGYYFVNKSVKTLGAFGGLARTNAQNLGCISTLLDGITRDSNWWYSIGTIHSCESMWNDNVIPGPIQSVNYVKLWIRVN